MELTGRSAGSAAATSLADEDPKETRHPNHHRPGAKGRRPSREPRQGRLGNNPAEGAREWAEGGKARPSRGLLGGRRRAGRARGSWTLGAREARPGGARKAQAGHGKGRRAWLGRWGRGRSSEGARPGSARGRSFGLAGPPSARGGDSDRLGAGGSAVGLAWPKAAGSVDFLCVTESSRFGLVCY